MSEEDEVATTDEENEVATTDEEVSPYYPTLGAEAHGGLFNRIVATSNDGTISRSINGGAWQSCGCGSATSGIFPSVNYDKNVTAGWTYKYGTGYGPDSNVVTAVASNFSIGSYSVSLSGATFTIAANCYKSPAVCGCGTFEVQYSKNGGGWTSVGTTSTSVNGERCSLTYGGEAGQKYKFRSRYFEMNRTSSWYTSGEYTVSSPPDKPTGVKAECSGNAGQSSRNVRVSWNAVPGATSYEVDRMDRGTGLINDRTNVYKGGATAITDTNVPDNSYGVVYYVYARNAMGLSSSGSASLSKIPCTVEVRAPGVPGKPTITLIDEHSAQVTWTAPTPGDGTITEYYLYNNVKSSGQWTENAGTTYTATREKDGDRFGFKVKARNSYGKNGSYSPDSDILVLPPKPERPIVTGTPIIVDDQNFAKFVWDTPVSLTGPILKYSLTLVSYRKKEGTANAWDKIKTDTFDLDADTNEFVFLVEEKPFKVEATLVAYNSIGPSDPGLAQVTFFDTDPDLPVFDGEIFRGPDHVIDHLMQNNYTFSELLDLNGEQAWDILEDLIENEANVLPEFEGPDHIAEYDEYMYGTMAEQYIEDVESAAGDIIEGFLGPDVPVFDVKKSRDEITDPTFEGPDHLLKYYEYVSDYWNASELPGSGSIQEKLKEWYPHYARTVGDVFFTIGNDIMRKDYECTEYGKGNDITQWCSVDGTGGCCEVIGLYVQCGEWICWSQLAALPIQIITEIIEGTPQSKIRSKKALGFSDLPDELPDLELGDIIDEIDQHTEKATGQLQKLNLTCCVAIDSAKIRLGDSEAAAEIINNLTEETLHDGILNLTGVNLGFRGLPNIEQVTDEHIARFFEYFDKEVPENVLEGLKDIALNEPLHFAIDYALGLEPHTIGDLIDILKEAENEKVL